MPDFAAGQFTDYALYSSIVLIVFVVARLANARPALALSIAVMPVLVAWVFTNPATHGLLLTSFGS